VRLSLLLFRNRGKQKGKASGSLLGQARLPRFRDGRGVNYYPIHDDVTGVFIPPPDLTPPLSKTNPAARRS